MNATQYASILPPLSSAEFEALEASIEREGVRVPIDVDEDGNILDGYHRWKIDPAAPQRVVAGLSHAQKVAYVLSSNLHRRNLSPDQKAALRSHQIEAARLLKIEGLDQAEVAARLGVARETIRDWLITNGGDAKGNKDNRVKVPKDERPDIYRRISEGEAQEQVAADYGISQPAVSKICTSEKKRVERANEIAQQKADIAAGKVTAAKGPFDVLVIDPPWPYGTSYDPNERRAANPYPEMSLDEIAALNVADRAAPDAVLWLWTTHKFMRHSFPLLDAWGFEEKAILTWVKDRMGLGSWLRSQSEFCILAVRGKPEITLINQTTVLNGKLREHSRKPDEFYALAHGLCPGPRRFDWFAREPREDWLVGGNDTERFS